MRRKTYFLINDTRYDNHHGCLAVIRNLHAAMHARGWQCAGSLPVSSSAGKLVRCLAELKAADLILVNGEGSLHHDSRNAMRLFDICELLASTHPVVLLNSVWQENNPEKWQPLVNQMHSVFVRDRLSQRELSKIVENVGYAPDLTFYDYPKLKKQRDGGYLYTDSVINPLTKKLQRLAAKDPEIDFVTLFTDRLIHTRGMRDWAKRIKYRVNPMLWGTFHINVPTRYKSLKFALANTDDLLARFVSSRGVCVARYHALCFAIQQQVPFVAIRSNSHKSESLLEDVGLPLDRFLVASDDIMQIKERLEDIARGFSDFAPRINRFNEHARHQINLMFDAVTG